MVAAGGGAHLLGFVAGQTGRGLQLEAPVSAIYLWQAVAGVTGGCGNGTRAWTRSCW